MRLFCALSPFVVLAGIVALAWIGDMMFLYLGFADGTHNIGSLLVPLTPFFIPTIYIVVVGKKRKSENET